MPSRKPITGEVTIGITTLGITPLPIHQCAPLSLQLIALKLPCAAAIAAPHRPPIRACEDGGGRPSHQLLRVHTTAPRSAQRSSSPPPLPAPASRNPAASVFPSS